MPFVFSINKCVCERKIENALQCPHFKSFSLLQGGEELNISLHLWGSRKFYIFVLLSLDGKLLFGFSYKLLPLTTYFSVVHGYTDLLVKSVF